MSRKELKFSGEVRKDAVESARPFTGEQYVEVHHVFPKELCIKYGIDPNLVVSRDNAIALESQFHAWIHGGSISKQDRECGWKGFEEEDYITLGKAFLGLSDEDFR